MRYVNTALYVLILSSLYDVIQANILLFSTLCGNNTTELYLFMLLAILIGDKSIDIFFSPPVSFHYHLQNVFSRSLGDNAKKGTGRSSGVKCIYFATNAIYIWYRHGCDVNERLINITCVSTFIFAFFSNRHALFSLHNAIVCPFLPHPVYRKECGVK